MTVDPHRLAHDVLMAVRHLAALYGCRIEVSSDTRGALGQFCCVASDLKRDHQGFGVTVEQAVENLRAQPERASTNRGRK